MEFCISSLGGKSGNFSADLVAGVFLIGLLVMAFLDRGSRRRVKSVGPLYGIGVSGGGSDGALCQKPASPLKPSFPVALRL